MCPRKLMRTLSAAVVAALLFSVAPAVAAPSPETAPRAGGFWFQLDQVLAGWWSDFSGSVERLFGRNGAGVDPNGTPILTTATDSIARTENGAGVDPNGG